MRSFPRYFGRSASAAALVVLFSGCSGSPEPVAPEPVAAPTPEPRRPEAPKSGLAKIDEARAPVTAPEPAQIDLNAADPMAVVEARGPDGEPATAMSLVVASRGDGEIEPCG